MTRLVSPTVVVVVIVCLLSLPVSAGPAAAGARVVEQENFTLELGLRLHPRMELERGPGPGAGSEWRRDFLVRRSRVKVAGKVLDARYALEWRIDGSDQFGSAPAAMVENGWIQLPLGGGAAVRAGLYDQPFSRDRLTSDSKQLAVDRGAVSGVPNALGLADNAVGFHVLGIVDGGRAAYALGLFDNRLIRADFQDAPMVVARLDINLGATHNVFRDAHFGPDAWYSFGVGGSYQGGIENAAGDDDGSRGAFGVDGMVDVPAAGGRLFVRGELNRVTRDDPGVAEGVSTLAWMGGIGFLTLEQQLQPFVRLDEVRLDELAGGGTRTITHLGANLYRQGHTLKFQGDIRLESGTGEAVDGGRVQAQIDF